MNINTAENKVKSIKSDLVRRYPISPLLDIRRTFWQLLAVVLVGTMATLSAFGVSVNYASPEVELIVAQGAKMLAFALLAVWLARVVYEALVRITTYYGIEDGHLVISRGIILKKRGFFPLSRITDVYIERSLLDLFFGLHTLHISTPTSLSERFARIDGLGAYSATALQRKLTAVLERSHPPLEVEEEQYLLGYDEDAGPLATLAAA